MSTLIGRVTVTNPKTFEEVTFEPGSEVDSWAVPLITNPGAWKDGQVPTGSVAAADTGAENGSGPVDDKPAGNASEAEWRDYALAHGKSEDELEGLGRNEIRDLFA